MKNKEEGRKTKFSAIFVSMFMIFGVFVVVGPIGVIAAGDLPFYDIEQDSLGNYHKAFIDDSTGNYEIYYTNDIGGGFPQDWNPSTRITDTITESMLLDLGIYLPTDTIFIIWQETECFVNCTTPGFPTYYTISQDYGENWMEPRRSYEDIVLKYEEFDPLFEEPNLPTLPPSWTNPYAYYIVQLKTPMIQEWWDGIEILGGVFCGYIPNNAHIIWMTPTMKDQVEQLPYVRWIGDYHPLYKIESFLLNTVGVFELNVMVFEETGGFTNLNKVITEIIALGGIIIYDGADNYIIRALIDASKIYDIAFIPEVEWIDGWAPPVTFMNNVRVFTGAHFLHVNGYSGQGIVGEVKDNGIEQVDPGIDLGHPDFGNLIAIDGAPLDEAHGTSTYGTVFSTGANDPNARGMLPQAQGVFCDYSIGRLVSIQNLQNNWQGVFQSNSWGIDNPLDPYDMNGQYVASSWENDQAVFNNDVTMVYAVGNSNEGVWPVSITQDSAAKNIISVGGVDHVDNANENDDLWVNRGPGLTPSQGPASDGRVKPDLCGPFDYGYVTDSVDGDGEPGYRVGDYVFRSPADILFAGTSFATPVVAGASGLVHQMYTDNFFGHNPRQEAPHASTIKALLIADAHQIDQGNPGLNPADGDGRFQQGWGMVDLERMVNVGRDHFIVDEYELLTTGDTASYSFTPMSTLPLKISLVWTDPPGTTSAAQHLINNLDLRVIDPNGDVYWGNLGLDTWRWSAIDAAPGNPANADILNNVENVFIENPMHGRWQVDVIGTAIGVDGHIDTPVIDQPFSLVVSYSPFYTTLQLYPEWNLISLPFIQSPELATSSTGQDQWDNVERLESVLRWIGDDYTAVQYYDAEDPVDQWKHWQISKPVHLIDLWDLGHKMGFWIYITAGAPITMRVYGWEIIARQDIPMWTGWNMVGYPSTQNHFRDDGLGNLVWQTDIQVIQYYDGLTQTWEEIVLAGDEFEIGLGYWMYYTGSQGNPVIWQVPFP